MYYVTRGISDTLHVSRVRQTHRNTVVLGCVVVRFGEWNASVISESEAPECRHICSAVYSHLLLISVFFMGMNRTEGGTAETCLS